MKTASLVVIVGLTFATNWLHADLLIKEGERVAFMGDSITQLGWEQAGGYVRLVVSGLAAAGVKVEPIPRGGGSNTSRNMLNRLDRDIFPSHPDWMTLSCGVNDVDLNGNLGVDLETYKQNVISIVDRVQAKGTKIILLTATPITENPDGEKNKRLAAYNDFLRQLARERKLPLAEVSAPFLDAVRSASGPGNHFTEDGIHMNSRGNRIMAEAVLRCIGLTDDQISKAQAAWNDDPEGAGIPALILFTGSLASDEAFKKAAAGQKRSADAIEQSLMLKSLQTVLQSHAKDDFLEPAKLQPEISREFSRLADAYVAQGPTSPPESVVAGGAKPGSNGEIKVKLVLKDRATFSFLSFEAFHKAIAGKHIDVEPFKRDLLLKSYGVVLQAHAQDDFPDMTKLKPEIEQEFSRRVLTFLGGPVPAATPKANP